MSTFDGDVFDTEAFEADAAGPSIEEGAGAAAGAASASAAGGATVNAAAQAGGVGAANGAAQALAGATGAAAGTGSATAVVASVLAASASAAGAGVCDGAGAAVHFAAGAAAGTGAAVAGGADANAGPEIREGAGSASGSSSAAAIGEERVRVVLASGYSPGPPWAHRRAKTETRPDRRPRRRRRILASAGEAPGASSAMGAGGLASVIAGAAQIVVTPARTRGAIQAIAGATGRTDRIRVRAAEDMALMLL